MLSQTVWPLQVFPFANSHLTHCCWCNPVKLIQHTSCVCVYECVCTLHYLLPRQCKENANYVQQRKINWCFCFCLFVCFLCSPDMLLFLQHYPQQLLVLVLNSDHWEKGNCYNVTLYWSELEEVLFYTVSLWYSNYELVSFLFIWDGNDTDA